MRFERYGDSPPVCERKASLLKWSAALTVSAVLLPAFSASAAALFMDAYEPSPSGNDVDGAAPLADIGSYNTANTNARVATYGATLTSPAGTAPTAITGGGLQTMRLQPASGGGRTAGTLSQPASAAGSAFHMEFDLYVSSSVSFGFGSQLQGENGSTAGLASPSSSRPKQSFLINIASGALTVSRDADNNPSTANTLVAIGLAHTANTFQHYAIDYVLGTNQVTLTAGSQTPVVLSTPFQSATDVDYDSSNGLQPATVSSLSQVDTIFFATGSSGAIGFVDNVNVTGEVPEPASFGLLCAAGALATRRARRQ